MKKGQASMEYLFIIAFLLLAIGLLFVFSLIIFDDTNRQSKAQIAISKLKNAADEVDGLGNGNTKFVEISLPGGVNEGIAIGNDLFFILDVSGGTTPASDRSYAQVSYVTLPTSEGIHQMKVESIDGNVLISEV